MNPHQQQLADKGNLAFIGIYPSFSPQPGQQKTLYLLSQPLLQRGQQKSKYSNHTPQQLKKPVRIVQCCMLGKQQ